MYSTSLSWAESSNMRRLHSIVIFSARLLIEDGSVKKPSSSLLEELIPLITLSPHIPPNPPIDTLYKEVIVEGETRPPTAMRYLSGFGVGRLTL